MKKFTAEASNEPLFRQMREFILQYLREHNFRIGDRIPSENDFCAVSEVSIRTVRRALADLEREGILVRLQGRGTFLKSLRVESPEAKKGTVGIMFSNMGFVTQPAFGALLEAMESRINELGYHYHLYATGKREESDALPLEQLLPREFPAAMIATSALNDADLAWLKQNKIPFCAFNEYRGVRVNHVRYDYEAAARMGLSYLRDKGCRRIAILAEKVGNGGGAVIYGNHVFRESAIDFCRESGQELVFHEGTQSREDGIEAALELWGMSKAPDAFFALNPVTALGVQAVARQAGGKPPEIISCMDLPDCSGITFLRSPLDAMGKAAVDIAIDSQTGDPAQYRRKIFSPELVEVKELAEVL